MRYRLLLCAICLVVGIDSLSSLSFGAVSPQYVHPGTPITYSDSGSTHIMVLQNLASLTGVYGARHDKGAGAQPGQWMWACSFTLTGTNVGGAQIEIYVSWSDGTYADGALGTTNGTLASADKRRDLKLVGTVIVDQTATNTTMTASGMAWIPTRYFSPAVWNGTTLPTQNVVNTSSCAFTPVPPEQQ